MHACIYCASTNLRMTKIKSIGVCVCFSFDFVVQSAVLFISLILSTFFVRSIFLLHSHTRPVHCVQRNDYSSICRESFRFQWALIDDLQIYSRNSFLASFGLAAICHYAPIYLSFYLAIWMSIIHAFTQWSETVRLHIHNCRNTDRVTVYVSVGWKLLLFARLWIVVKLGTLFTWILK